MGMARQRGFRAIVSLTGSLFTVVEVAELLNTRPGAPAQGPDDRAQ